MGGGSPSAHIDPQKPSRNILSANGSTDPAQTPTPEKPPAQTPDIRATLLSDAGNRLRGSGDHPSEPKTDAPRNLVHVEDAVGLSQQGRRLQMERDLNDANVPNRGMDLSNCASHSQAWVGSPPTSCDRYPPSAPIRASQLKIDRVQET